LGAVRSLPIRAAVPSFFALPFFLLWKQEKTTGLPPPPSPSPSFPFSLSVGRKARSDRREPSSPFFFPFLPLGREPRETILPLLPSFPLFFFFFPSLFVREEIEEPSHPFSPPPLFFFFSNTGTLSTSNSLFLPPLPLPFSPLVEIVK